MITQTDLDFTNAPAGGGIYASTVKGESLTITWLNAPYFCGVQAGAPTIACKTPIATASFQ